MTVPAQRGQGRPRLKNKNAFQRILVRLMFAEQRDLSRWEDF
jgi:hypothetical protein